jgi:hypothetical protein
VWRVLKEKPIFEGHQLLIPSALFERRSLRSTVDSLDGILGRVVDELKRLAATDETLSVDQAAKCLAFHEDLRDRPFWKSLTRADHEFIERLSVIFRSARYGGYGVCCLGMSAGVEKRTVGSVLRLREEEEHMIRNLIASPKLRLSDERFGGVKLVPLPNSIDSTTHGAHAFEQNFLISLRQSHRQEHACLVQDGYVEFVTLKTIASTNAFVWSERAKLQRLLIGEFIHVDHTFRLGFTVNELVRNGLGAKVRRDSMFLMKVQYARKLRQSHRPPL